MTIWKFGLLIRDTVTITMPKDAQILCVQMQYGAPQIWAVVNEYAPLEQRTIYVRGTGHPMAQAAKYIGTFQTGDLVWHVFDGGAL